MGLPHFSQTSSETSGSMTIFSDLLLARMIQRNGEGFIELLDHLIPVLFPFLHHIQLILHRREAVTTLMMSEKFNFHHQVNHQDAQLCG